MKRKLLFISILALVSVFVRCEPPSYYRIQNFDSMSFDEWITDSTNTWHGNGFSLTIKMNLKEINPLYVQCFDFLSPVERCYAMLPEAETYYYKKPDLSTAELLLDKRLTYNGTVYEAGTNILPLSSDQHLSKDVIVLTFSPSQQEPKIDIAEGDVVLLFRCNVGDEVMSVSKQVEIAREQQ